MYFNSLFHLNADKLGYIWAGIVQSKTVVVYKSPRVQFNESLVVSTENTKTFPNKPLLLG